MKYSKEEYENIIFSIGEEDVSNYSEKVIKVRKTHQCADCENEIQAGENALVEKGFMDGQPVSCYHCINCCDKWLDEINGFEKDDDVVCSECIYCVDHDCNNLDCNKYGECVDGIVISCDLFKQK